MDKKQKPILTVDEQIQHLQQKGVKFEKMSVKDAKEYLTLHNNYFKLASYRKNFPKHPGGPHAGTYIDLDFAMLKDLSIIDMYLRYTLLQMALDIEHFAQVRLMRAVESSGNDGYQIVTDYMEALRANDAKTGRHSYEILQQDLNRNRNSSYCGGIISAYNGCYPVWAFAEIIPFGDFVHFYKFCGDAFQCKDMINQYYLLLTTKELRNAAAHNNCIINDISSRNSRYKCNYGMLRALDSISKTTRDKKLSNEHLRQIVTLLYTHSVIVTSDGIHRMERDALHKLTARMYQHIDYYSGNPTILSGFNFLKSTIDIFFP